MGWRKPRGHGETIGSADRLRVLVVDYSVGFGGATKSIGLVGQSLPDVSLRILTCQEPVEYHRWYPGRPIHVFRRVFNYQNIERVRDSLPAALTGRIMGRTITIGSLTSNVWNAARLMRLLKQHPVDLVHLNNGYAPSEVLWVARRLGIPVVVHMRGFTSPEDIRKHSMGVARVVAVSQSIAKSVAAGGFPVNRTPIIWDPVDLALFDRSKEERGGIRSTLGIREDEVAIGLFGRVVRWKGTLEFVRACARALHGGARIRPVIVGDISDGTQNYFDEVRAEVAASPFAERFIFTGYQPEPAGHYHAVDVVAHTSIEPEPFGMVVPEGMAAGKPVIAAAAGGPLEIVEDDMDGVLTPAGDVTAITAAIMRLAFDTPLRLRMGANGRRKAVERFSVESCAAALLAVWKSAVVR